MNRLNENYGHLVRWTIVFEMPLQEVEHGCAGDVVLARPVAVRVRSQRQAARLLRVFLDTVPGNGHGTRRAAMISTAER